MQNKEGRKEKKYVDFDKWPNDDNDLNDAAGSYLIAFQGVYKAYNVPKGQSIVKLPAKTIAKYIRKKDFWRVR